MRTPMILMMTSQTSSYEIQVDVASRFSGFLGRTLLWSALTIQVFLLQFSDESWLSSLKSGGMTKVMIIHEFLWKMSWQGSGVDLYREHQVINFNRIEFDWFGQQSNLWITTFISDTRWASPKSRPPFVNKLSRSKHLAFFARWFYWWPVLQEIYKTNFKKYMFSQSLLLAWFITFL